jgi:hypothetical protein
MKKTIDVVTQRMFGLAAIIFAVCLGISSITNNSVKADNPTTVNEMGKVMLDMNSFVHDGKFYFHVVAWDTETGKSKMYYYSKEKGEFSSVKYQLPSSPLY